MTFVLHTAVLLSLTTRSLKKPSPVGMSTTRGRFRRQDFNGRTRSGCSAISTWTDPVSRIGPLIVLPRGLNDPIDPKGDVAKKWEGQIEVVVPPGSAVIFDTALWHCSKRGSSSELRHLWGGHYQGWSNPTPHPEDNTAENPTVAAFKAKLPVLRGLLEGPQQLSVGIC